MRQGNDDQMRTEADLIAALRALERRAPDPGQVLRAIRAATGPRQERRRRRVKRWALGGIAAAVACGTAVAVTLTLVSGGTPSHRGHTAAGHPPVRRTASKPALTARQVLLLAAAHVAKTPTSGKYWYLNAKTGTVLPAGTKAHPYNIVTEGSLQVWYPRVPGVLAWTSDGYTTPGFQSGHATPLTSADWASWRAAGSPTGWFPNTNWPGHPDEFTIRPAQPPQYSWNYGDGVVGYIEGNLSGLNTAQLAQLPASAAGLRAYLFARVDRYLPQMKPGGTLVWTMALDLLMDPVSSEVRAAAFRVMATIPGVKVLGMIRDPFGRQGYGLRLDGFRLYGSDGWIGAIINPATGLLLDTSYHDFTSRGAQRLVCHGHPPAHKPGPLAAPGQPPAVYPWVRSHCKWVPAYYGPPYSGLLDDYTAFLSVGWVNSLPHMPPAAQSNHTNLVFFQVP
jgi:hypothetical protein